MALPLKKIEAKSITSKQWSAERKKTLTEGQDTAIK